MIRPNKSGRDTAGGALCNRAPPCTAQSKTTTARTRAVGIFMFAYDDILIAYGFTSTGDWRPPSDRLFAAALNLVFIAFLVMRLAHKI